MISSFILRNGNRYRKIKSSIAFFSVEVDIFEDDEDDEDDKMMMDQLKWVTFTFSGCPLTSVWW